MYRGSVSLEQNKKRKNTKPKLKTPKQKTDKKNSCQNKQTKNSPKNNSLEFDISFFRFRRLFDNYSI